MILHMGGFLLVGVKLSELSPIDGVTFVYWQQIFHLINVHTILVENDVQFGNKILQIRTVVES